MVRVPRSRSCPSPCPCLGDRRGAHASAAPSLLTKRLRVPAKIHRLNISGKCSMDMRIPPLNIKIMLESNSRILAPVRRLAVTPADRILRSLLTRAPPTFTQRRPTRTRGYVEVKSDTHPAIHMTTRGSRRKRRLHPRLDISRFEAARYESCLNPGLERGLHEACGLSMLVPIDLEGGLDPVRPAGEAGPDAGDIGDPKNVVRGYCLDIPRFEESLNN